VRNEGRGFTYSAGMCQVALDRAAHLADQSGVPERASAWRQSADRVCQAILDRAWGDKANTLSAVLDGGASLDASLLALLLRRVVAADGRHDSGCGGAPLRRWRTPVPLPPRGVAGWNSRRWGGLRPVQFLAGRESGQTGKLDEAASLYADVQISRIQLSDKASRFRPRTVARQRLDIDQSELLVEVFVREA